MAALVVQSRFAGLKIEDDDHSQSHEDQKAKKNKTNTVKKPDQLPKKNKNGNAKTPNTVTSQPKKKKVKPNASTSKQWELWRQKDEEMVDGNFESELHEAILQSKLDYEEKKDVYKQSQKESQVEKKIIEQTRPGKKQKKKNVMSLEQFNDMVAGDDTKNNNLEEKNMTEEIKTPEPDPEFFDRVEDDTKNELFKEKFIDRVKHRLVTDEIITRVQFADTLERKDKEIATLRDEVTSLKEELLTVKSRNKKLCNILGQGEMRDKAAVLVEVERLRVVQNELTAELESLHSQLERERSKHPDPRARDKKKKFSTADKEK